MQILISFTPILRPGQLCSEAVNDVSPLSFEPSHPSHEIFSLDSTGTSGLEESVEGLGSDVCRSTSYPDRSLFRTSSVSPCKLLSNITNDTSLNIRSLVTGAESRAGYRLLSGFFVVFRSFAQEMQDITIK